jgi:hypothetical protein
MLVFVELKDMLVFVELKRHIAWLFRRQWEVNFFMTGGMLLGLCGIRHGGSEGVRRHRECVC